MEEEITVTVSKLKVAFAKWREERRTNPSAFMSHEEADAKDNETSASECAVYLFELLKEAQ